MCMCMCMYVCMYVHMRYVLISPHIRMYGYKYVCMYVNTCMHAYNTHTHIHACMHAYIQTCMHTYVYIHTCFMYKCINNPSSSSGPDIKPYTLNTKP